MNNQKERMSVRKQHSAIKVCPETCVAKRIVSAENEIPKLKTIRTLSFRHKVPVPTAIGGLYDRVRRRLKKDIFIPNWLCFYFIILSLQVMPLLIGCLNLHSILDMGCDRSLQLFSVGCLYASGAHFVLGTYVMRRMINRTWPDQTFLESLAQIWSFSNDEQFTQDHFLFKKQRLNVYIIILNAFSAIWCLFGIIEISLSDPTLCANLVTRTGTELVSWLLINTCVISSIEIVGYFHLEVSSYSKH